MRCFKCWPLPPAANIAPTPPRHTTRRQKGQNGRPLTHHLQSSAACGSVLRPREHLRGNEVAADLIRRREKGDVVEPGVAAGALSADDGVLAFGGAIRHETLGKEYAEVVLVLADEAAAGHLV